MAARTIVVIGGAQGGPVAAARAREFDENARIVLIEKGSHVSWVRPSLRHALEGQGERLTRLDQDRARFFDKRYRIEVRTGTEAVGLDNDARRVIVHADEGVERIGYDAVIFAGGAGTAAPSIEGLEGPGVSSFRDLEDLHRIERLLSAGARHAVVIGGGGFGIDAAEGLRARGVDVVLVERDSRILPGLSLTASCAATRALREQGTELLLGDEVVRADTRGDTGRRLTLRSGRTLDTDLVIVATGMEPRSKLLREAGASINSDGTIRVDRHMQTTLPRVYACGTAVSVPHAVTGGNVWLVQNAIIDRTAQIAGRSAAVGPTGVREELSPVAGTAMHQIGDSWFARTGLSDAEARSALGDERVCVVTVHSWSSEAWLAGDVITVRLVVDRDRDTVVGGEVWGTKGVPRRIDIIAAATIERWSPSRVADLDVAYAPTLGPAYDPVNAAGTLAAMTIAGETRAMHAELLTLKLAQGDPLQLVDVGVGDRGDREVWPEGARHIALEDLRDRLDEIDKDTPVVLLSHTGRRAHLAARILQQRGFDEVYFLDGGALTWALTLDAGGGA